MNLHARTHQKKKVYQFMLTTLHTINVCYFLLMLKWILSSVCGLELR